MVDSGLVGCSAKLHFDFQLGLVVLGVCRLFWEASLSCGLHAVFLMCACCVHGSWQLRASAFVVPLRLCGDVIRCLGVVANDRSRDCIWMPF